MRLLPILMLLGLPLVAAENDEGAQAFQKVCAVCHLQATPGGRTPTLAQLRTLPVPAILQALESGIMQSQGSNLTRAERAAVAAYLGVAPAAPASSVTNRCPADPTWKPEAFKTDSLWGGDLSNQRFVAEPGFPASAIPKLKLRWAFGLPNTTNVRSQPAVFGGRIFVGAQDGSVFALDAKTGCTHWLAKADSMVRSGLSVTVVGSRALVLLGDVRGTVYGLDAGTGAVVWRHKLDEHPGTMASSTPVGHRGRVYVGASSMEEVTGAAPNYVCCTFRGSVSALNATDGSLIWKTYTIPETPVRAKNAKGLETIGPSGAGVWSSPTLDPGHNRLYVTTGDNYSDPPNGTSDAVLAMDLADGHILWTRQFTKGDAFNVACGQPGSQACPEAAGPDYDFGAPPMLVELPNKHRALILGQKSGMLHAIDPDNSGVILWQTRVAAGSSLGGIQWGPATDGNMIFAAVSDIAFSGSMATGVSADPKRGGGIHGVRVSNGERMWDTPNPGNCEGKPTCSPAQSAAVTAIPGAVFSGAVDSHLRAYDAKTGKVLWDFDAGRDFPTVNGVKGTGGAFDAGGPVISGGMLFTNSGYGQWGGKPGNVVLAFSAE